MSSKNKALIIGISRYQQAGNDLPAVDADVREISRLLGSSNGAFRPESIDVLLDSEATGEKISAALRGVFEGATPDETVFIYLAGHGMIGPDGDYWFLPVDFEESKISQTGISLKLIKEWFDESRGEKILMWMDFCHSGGILARGLTKTLEGDPAALVARSLRLVQGKGKVIMCACTADQQAYEDPSAHGHFTRYLLEGLQGRAANGQGEVTANSLHDFIDSAMGSARQRPMFFGTQTGRIVLMHSRSIGLSQAMPAGIANDVVADSGPWVILGDFYFESSKVSNTGGQIVVDVPSKNSDEDAEIRSLAPVRFSNQAIPFAHRNDGQIVRVVDLSSESDAGRQVWRITLRVEEVEYGGGIMNEMSFSENGRNYSPDEIAEMRGRRLLLDEQVAGKRPRGQRDFSMIESMVEGVSNPYAVKSGLFPRLRQSLKKDQTTFLQVARLFAIYALKASHVFEHVLELKLGPLKEGKLTVYCRGRRRKVYSNHAATEFEIRGDCDLSAKTLV